MKKVLASIFLILPTISLAAQYTGHITKISVCENGKNLRFEVANTDNKTCESSWFKVVKPGDNEILPAEFVVDSYFKNTPITIHAPSVCATVDSPSKVRRVTLGTSTEEVKAMIQAIREKRKVKK